MAELDPGYGVRMQQSRERLYPSSVQSTLPPLVEAAPQVSPELLGMIQQRQQAAAPTLKKFPEVVTEQQGTGAKFDKPTLEAIRDKYKTEQFTPWLTGQKGADKLYVETHQAAFDSKADDWIKSYLGEEAIAAEQAAADEGKKGILEKGFGLIGGLAEHGMDTATAIGSALAKVLPQLAETTETLRKLGVTPSSEVLNAIETAYKLATKGEKELTPQDLPTPGGAIGALITRGPRASAEQLGRKTPIEAGAQGLIKFIDEKKEGLLSEETKRQMKELDAKEGFASSAAYVLTNPRMLEQMGGDLIGQLLPAVFTGGASVEATVAPRVLAALNARFGPRVAGVLVNTAKTAATNVGSLGYSTAQQTGAQLVDTRNQIEQVPLASLLESPQNKQVYDMYTTELGLSSALAEQKLRETLYAKVTPTILAANAATGVLSAGLGAPLERSAAGLGRAGAALRAPGGRGRAAGAGAAEEAVSSLPQDIAQNIAEEQFTGKEVPLTRGLGKQAALNILMGGAAGGALHRRAPEAPVTPTPEAEVTGEVPPPLPGVGAAQAAPQTAPGAGLEDTTHKKVLKTVVNAAKGAKDVKDVLKTLDNADDFLGGVTSFLEEGLGSSATSFIEEVPEAWAQMNTAQRLGAVESAAGEFMRVAKNDAVRSEVTSKLAEQRAAVVAAPVTTAPVAAPEAPQAAAAAAPPPLPEAAAPVPKPKTKPLKKQVEAPAPVVAKPAPKAAEETEVIKLGEPIPGERPLVPKPAAPKAEPVVAQPAGEPKLPAELSKLAPTYGLKKLQFDSDIDRAAYGSTGKAAAKYTAWLKEAGFSDAGIASLREKIKAKIKAGVTDNQKAGNVRVTTTYKGEAPTPAAKAQPLKKAPAKAIQEAEKEAKAQDEADKTKAKTDKLKAAAQKAKAVKPEPKPLKKEAPKPPKEVAPVSEPGQEARPAPTTTKTQTARETPEQAVERIAPELERADKTNIHGLIATVREGAPATELEEAMREAELTPAQKKAVREAARQTTPSEEGLTESAKAEMPKSFATSQQAYEYARDANLGGKGMVEALKRVPMDKHLESILERIEPLVAKADITLRDFTEEELAGFAARGVDRNNVGGAYRIFENSLTLSGKGGPAEAIHELIHSITSNALAQQSPDPKMQKLQQEMEDLRQYVRAYVKNNPGTVTIADPRLKKATGPLGNSREFVAYGMTDPYVMALLRKIPAPPNSNLGNAWQEFVRIVADFFGINPEDRTAFNDLVDITDRLLATLEANPEELTAARLRTSLGKISPHAESQPFDFVEHSESRYATTPTDADKKIPNARTPINVLDPIWERAANSAIALERAEQEVHRKGGKVTDDNSIYYANRRYTSAINEMRKLDAREVVDPIADWIANSMGRFGETDPDTFRKHLDQFLQSYHILHERNPSWWAEKVKLDGGAEVKRALINRRAKEGKITGPQRNAQLIALAQQKATMPLGEWATKYVIAPSKLKATLETLAKKGYTVANTKDLHALMEALKERTRSRKIKGGIISENDPTADRGWKYYVPLKGNLAISEDMADTDIGAFRGSSKAFRSGNLQTAEGRKTHAGNALEQMAEDMSTAALEEATKIYQETLTKFGRQNKAITGMQVRVFQGNPKEGFTTTQGWKRRKKGGAPKVTSRDKTTRRKELPNPANGFIMHDGDTHYEVQFPEDSLMLRGLLVPKETKSLDTVEEKLGPVAGKAARAVAFATNTLGRLQTTVDPLWTAAVAFARDTNALPLTVAAEVYERPWEAAAFFAHYTKNLTANLLSAAVPKNWEAEFAIIMGDEAKLAKYAEANPNSFAARMLQYRLDGGSTEYAQAFSKDRARNVLYGKLKQKQATGIKRAGMTALQGIDKFNEVTGNWAQTLELRARVAAYESLKANGKDGKTAAAIVKGALDFGQSGTWGKLINAIHAFYRVGATSADTVRRITTKKGGTIDWKKAAWWGGFASAVGYAQYMLFASLLGDDEEDKDENGKPVKRIAKYDINTLTQNILIPDGEGGVYTYRIGLGLPQLMMAPGIIAAHLDNGALTPKQAVQAYYDVFTRNYPAIQPEGQQKDKGLTGFISSWLKGMIPSTLRPFVESETNISRFDSPIHTAYPKADKPAAVQGMPETADEWKDMAAFLHRSTDGSVDMYPETVRHFIGQYGGQVSNRIIYWTIDKQNKEEQGLELPAARTAARIGAADEEFYYRKEAREAMATLQAADKQVAFHEKDDEDGGKAWRRENAGAVKRAAGKTALDSARDAYYDELKAIRADKLKATEGKSLARKKADAKLREAVNKANKLIEDTE